MSDRLNEGQLDDLLDYLDVRTQTYWKSGEKLICCPVHGESNPSMGVSVEKQVCHCFSCGFAGDFAKLLLYSKPEEFGFLQDTPENKRLTEFQSYKRARLFLKERYELEYRELGVRLRSVKRYEQVHNKFLREDSTSKRQELPRFKLAPFKSGKETYKYFFDRGFTKGDMTKFLIGRDLDNKTITIPVFHEDGVLAGIIGRYISPDRKKNQRYKIYNDFMRGKLLYPLNIAHPINSTIIVVEGQLDAIRMHRAGYSNTYASMTNTLSKEQVKWIEDNCDTVIWVGDNDSRGVEGRDKARKQLKRSVKFKEVTYPDHGKDVCDWSDSEIAEMIKSARSSLTRRLRRFDD